MSELDSITESVNRSTHTNTVRLNNVVVSQKTTTQYMIRLKAPSPYRFTLKGEGVVEKVVKLFKKELQTGDADFDAKVYISTDSPDETARFLSDENNRLLALGFVRVAPVEVDGAVVQLEVEGSTNEDSRELVLLIKALQR